MTNRILLKNLNMLDHQFEFETVIYNKIHRLIRYNAILWFRHLRHFSNMAGTPKLTNYENHSRDTKSAYTQSDSTGGSVDLALRSRPYYIVKLAHQEEYRTGGILSRSIGQTYASFIFITYYSIGHSRNTI